MTRSVSPIRVSSTETLASGTLQIVIPDSDVDGSEDGMRVSALATDPMTDAVTAAVIHRQ